MFLKGNESNAWNNIKTNDLKIRLQLNVKNGGEKFNIANVYISFLGMLCHMCLINNKDNKAQAEKGQEKASSQRLCFVLYSVWQELWTGMYQLVTTL